MHPQQTTSPQSAGAPNPYDFVLNQPQKKNSRLPSSKSGRILIIAVVGVLLLVIGAVVVGILGSGDKGPKDYLITAVKQQSELARISEIAATKARSYETANLAATTRYTILSDQQNTLDLLKKIKVKIGQRELLQSKDSRNDDTLTQADQTNQFDDVYVKLLQSKLTEYQGTLKQAFNMSKNNTTQQLLSAAYKNAGMLANPPTPSPAESN